MQIVKADCLLLSTHLEFGLPFYIKPTNLTSTSGDKSKILSVQVPTVLVYSHSCPLHPPSAPD